jgi:tRNA threonylcarbamoyladenosine biosynthesis protein TsaB
MSTILAIDTATGPCSAAIWHNGRIAAYVENPKPVQQSASLMLMVEEALKTARLTYKDLTLVACTTGPGSFTGIRVGMAAAHGIAFAAGIRETGFTTLDVLAFAGRAHKDVLAILNAGKGEWYYQAYSAGQAAFEPRLATLEVALGDVSKEAVLIGNAAAPGFTSLPVTFPRADALAELASQKAGTPTLTPYYIRDPDAKLPAART